MWAAATPRPTGTRQSTPGRSGIRSSARSSRARTGSGATSIRCFSCRHFPCERRQCPGRSVRDRHMTDSATAPSGHPYAAELDAERAGWYELAALVRQLTPEEYLVTGYYRDPDWAVRDV